MHNINELTSRFENVAKTPKAQLEKALDDGKKCIGLMPCFVPEELAYALGFACFGLWGAQRQVSESKRYYPSFICSILHTVLDLGIKGEYDGLSAVMVPMMCDSIKGMSANWRYGIKNIPVIDVPYAQNRAIPAGVEFTTAKFEEVNRRLEEIAGRKSSEEEIRNAIEIYNENRDACMKFTALAGSHPELISCVKRSSILKARYFMDKKEHTAWLRELNTELANVSNKTAGQNVAITKDKKYLRLVTTGIIADMPQLLSIFDENKISIVADQILHESVENMWPVPQTENPVEGLALRLARLQGTSVLYDPTKKRAAQLVTLAEKIGADGVIWIGTKFCDPEEFDYVPVKRLLDEKGIPVLTIEIDRQMENFEQIRTAVETFKTLF